MELFDAQKEASEEGRIRTGKVSEKKGMKKNTVRNEKRIVPMTFTAVAAAAGILAGGNIEARAEEELLLSHAQTEQTSEISAETGTEEMESLGEDLSDDMTETDTEAGDEIESEDIVIETETGAEGELIFEPEYHLEQDPNPLMNKKNQPLEMGKKEALPVISLSDTDWIAVNGTMASCRSHAKIGYGYRPETEVGTIRYISQLTGSGLFSWDYWGGWGNQAGIECGTASISMALSYIGVNLTPQEILDCHGGLTYFTGWGVTDIVTDVATAMDQYINGRGQYSPVIVHLPYYSALGHYVVLIGKLSDAEYLVLDCAQDDIWVMTVGSDLYASIDQVYQYYNPNALLLDHSMVTDAPVMASCIRMGKTRGEHCQVCGETMIPQEAVPCNGHAWSDWTWKTQAAKEQTGEKSRYCKVCQAEDRRMTEALPEELHLEMPEAFWK